MVCGDLNARTGCQQPKQESMFNYSPSFDDDDDYDEGGGDVLYRYSMDKGVNNFGKSLLNLCFLLDCRIVNGSCGSDKCGDFTYVSPHGRSVIDYCVISSELFLLNCWGLHVADGMDSWHLPVEFSRKNFYKDTENPIQVESCEDKIIRPEVFLLAYKDKLTSDVFKQYMQDARCALCTDVDVSLDIFEGIVQCR